MKCYICDKEITVNQLKARKAFRIGEGLARHQKCYTKILSEKSYKKIRKKLGRNNK